MTVNMFDHQKLMDEVYDYWKAQRDSGNQITRYEALENFSDLHHAAVIMGNLNYQVCNGGFAQWDDNGYSDDLEALKEICDKGIELGLSDFVELKKILLDFEDVPEERHYTDIVTCSDCKGKGYFNEEDEEGEEIEVNCYECDGTGKVDEETDNWDEIREELDSLDNRYYELETIEEQMQELLNKWNG